jgi:hypothetical protein
MLTTLGWAVVMITCLVLAGCSSTPPAAPDSPTGPGGPTLTERQRALALEAAHSEARRIARTVTSATATVGPGSLPLEQSNAGHACTSGTVLHITLIGTFNAAVPGPSIDPSATPPDYSVTAEDITADAETGDICFISVRIGAVTPAPGTTVLITG